MTEKRPITSRESSYEQAIRKRPRRGLQSLVRTVSPPRRHVRQQSGKDCESVAAAVEAGREHVADQLAFYSSHLFRAIQPELPGEPRLAHQDWINLYKRNAGSTKGSHFVVHQHDHPIAGTHYDLRLQCNTTSSISFAIMYGLPGDPNSKRLNRNATETRVHCLWNHLIETASHTTGSMLIWDTGEYEVLPYNGEDNYATDDSVVSVGIPASNTQQARLSDAFRKRKIKLKLHGTRLPLGYTISLRLTKDNYRSQQPAKRSRRRRRNISKKPEAEQVNVTDEERERPSHLSKKNPFPPFFRISTALPQQSEMEVVALEDAAAVASDDEDETIRASNAYIGATNDIGSVHQRKWYLSIDRKASGFAKIMRKSSSGFVETLWKQTTEDKLIDGVVGGASGFDKFVVGGRDSERSIVTGRLAEHILADEGVVDYIPRGLWRPVTE